MMQSFGPPNLRSCQWLAGLVAATVLLAPSAARAALVLDIQSVNAVSGSSGNALDVTLTNTGPSSVTVGGFSFEISTPTPNINFTDATTATTTAPYIFGTHSLFGPSIATSTGQTLDASDTYSVIGSGATVDAGATVGLGHAIFDVAAGTPSGPITVSFTAGPLTSLSDPMGKLLTIDTLNSGVITVTETTNPVPEPPGLISLGAVMLFSLGAFCIRHRKRRAAQPAPF